METDYSQTDYNILTTVLVFIFTFLLVFINTRRQRRIPPGPSLFPIVGNLPSLMTSDPLGRLEELNKQYGDVFGIYSGLNLVVFLNGYDTIYDALSKQGSVFMHRAKPNFDQGEAVHTKGLIFPEGARWKEGRSFTLTALQEICYSDKGYVERIINEEVHQLRDIMGKFNEPFDIERYINASVSNIMFQVVYGHRFELNDEELQWLLKTIRLFSEGYLKREVVLNCLPWLKNLPGDILGIQKTRDTFSKVDAFLARFIEHLKNNDDKQSGTYVGNYLQRMAANERDGIESTMDEENMRISAYHLIVAGSETTATTIRWIILYLIRNPHIQDKMYAEIRKVIGSDPPCVEDRKKLPYVHAVVLEGLRISHVAPLGLPHTVLTDTMFHGYLIPGNCTVIANLRSASMDPEVWKNPEEFRPERFLTADESDVTIPKQFIPFSLGPRACLGETLARIEIFLFVTGLMQNLKFLPEQDGIYPETKGVLATTLNTKAFKMRIIGR